MAIKQVCVWTGTRCIWPKSMFQMTGEERCKKGFLTIEQELQKALTMVLRNHSGTA